MVFSLTQPSPFCAPHLFGFRLEGHRELVWTGCGVVLVSLVLTVYTDLAEGLQARCGQVAPPPPHGLLQTRNSAIEVHLSSSVATVLSALCWPNLDLWTGTGVGWGGRHFLHLCAVITLNTLSSWWFYTDIFPTRSLFISWGKPTCQTIIQLGG